MGFSSKMKDISRKITQVYVAMKSPKTPWYAKVVGATAVLYALSPIDFIPDFIPVIGYLDDLQDGKPVRWYYAIPVVVIWITIVLVILYAIFR